MRRGWVRLVLGLLIVALVGIAYWLFQAPLPNVAAVAITGVALGVCVALALVSWWPRK